jgi:hypothetical protein
MLMVVEMIMPVATAPHAHSKPTRHAHFRTTRHPHPGATSEGMSAAKATTVAATVGGSCD